MKTQYIRQFSAKLVPEHILTSEATLKAIVASLLVLVAAPAYASYQACMEAIAQDSKYVSLTKKLSLAATKTQTFEMLANTTKPTKADLPLIASWIDERQTCYTGHEDEKARMHPTVQALVARLNNQFRAAAADLYSGAITYGEFAKRRAAMSDQYQASSSR